MCFKHLFKPAILVFAALTAYYVSRSFHPRGKELVVANDTTGTVLDVIPKDDTTHPEVSLLCPPEGTNLTSLSLVVRPADDDDSQGVLAAQISTKDLVIDSIGLQKLALVPHDDHIVAGRDKSWCIQTKAMGLPAGKYIAHFILEDRQKYTSVQVHLGPFEFYVQSGDAPYSYRSSFVLNRDDFQAVNDKTALWKRNVLSTNGSLKKCNSNNKCVGADKAEYTIGEQITVRWENTNNNKWRVVIIPDGKGVSNQNAKMQNRAIGKDGEKTFQQTSDLTAGVYNVYLTSQRYTAIAGPVKITIVSGSPVPPAPPTTAPPPPQSFPKKCNSNNKCVGVDKAEYTIGEEITVRWENTNNNKWRVVIIPDGKGVSNQNAKMQNRAIGKDGEKTFQQTSDLTAGVYNVYLTSQHYTAIAGPVKITIVSGSPVPPTTAPSPPSSSILKKCNTNKPNNCIQINKDTKILGTDDSIRVTWINSPSTTFKIVLVMKGNDVAYPLWSHELGSTNGSVEIPRAVDNFELEGYFEIFLTSNLRVQKAGPLVIHIALRSPTESPSNYPTDQPSKSPTDQPSKSPTRSCVSFQVYNSSTSSTSSTVSLPNIGTFLGCFGYNDVFGGLTLSDEYSYEERASFCLNHCKALESEVFGVGSKCTCFQNYDIETLFDYFLSTDFCEFNNVCEEEKMDILYNSLDSTECDLPIASLRDRLTDGREPVHGFNILRNTHHLSPFSLQKKGCGTNMYDLVPYTESVSNIVETNRMSSSEYLSRKKEGTKNSVKITAGGGMMGVNLESTYTYDTVRNYIQEKSGIQYFAGSVYSAVGTRIVANSYIPNFQSQKNFVTFNELFVNTLKDYQRSDFDEYYAHRIFTEYGMMVYTNALYGGYLEINAISNNEDSTVSFLNEEMALDCWSLSVKTEFELAKFNISAGIDTSSCSEDLTSTFSKLQERYSENTSTERYVGGTPEDGFTVNFDTAALLTSSDKYPEGKNPEIYFLSEFLRSDKIHALQVLIHKMSFDDFDIIADKLEQQIMKDLDDAGLLLAECGDCDSPGAVLNNGHYQCKCYDAQCNATNFASFGDGVCDADNNNQYCNWDNNDCLPPCGNSSLPIFQPQSHIDYYIHSNGLYWQATGSGGLAIKLTNDKYALGTKWKFIKRHGSNGYTMKNVLYDSIIADDPQFLYLISSTQDNPSHFLAHCEEASGNTVHFTLHSDSRLQPHCKNSKCIPNREPSLPRGGCSLNDAFVCDEGGTIWLTDFGYATTAYYSWLGHCDVLLGSDWYEYKSTGKGNGRIRYCASTGNPEAKRYDRYTGTTWTLEWDTNP